MRSVILAFLLSICGISGFSQQKPFVFGFKGGLTMGWMNPDSKDYESTGLKAGYTWGFIADIFLMENYGLTTGFDVVSLNAGLEMPASISNDAGETLNGSLDRKYSLQYIQVPFTFKMQTGELGKFRIFGNIGLGANFLIGARADDEFNPESGSIISEDDVDIYDDITFMRLALILAAGTEFNLGGSTSLLAGLSFNNGFMNILNGTNSFDPSINNKARANYLALEVGIVF